MSVLTALSAARMQVHEILRTRCADCKHPLSDHSVSAPLYAGDPRSASNPQCKGEMRSAGVRPNCKCKGFREVEAP